MDWIIELIENIFQVQLFGRQREIQMVRLSDLGLELLE